MNSISNFNSLQVKYEQRFVGGLTLLNSFTWEHSLDNASASLEGNTPSPQDGNNIQADYAQSDYNLPIANVTSLVYELPFGHGRQFLASANPLLDNVCWAAGRSAPSIPCRPERPSIITYTPNGAQAVSPQISATYRGANEYRPDIVSGAEGHPGTSETAPPTPAMSTTSTSPPSCCRRSRMRREIRSEPVRQCQRAIPAARRPSTRPTSREQEVQHAGREPEDRVPNGVLQLLQPHQSVPAEHHQRNAGHHHADPRHRSDAGLWATSSGGVPNGGGQITSTFEPRILQFGLKIIY